MTPNYCLWKGHKTLKIRSNLAICKKLFENTYWLTSKVLREDLMNSRLWLRAKVSLLQVSRMFTPSLTSLKNSQSICKNWVSCWRIERKWCVKRRNFYEKGLKFWYKTRSTGSTVYPLINDKDTFAKVQISLRIN